MPDFRVYYDLRGCLIINAKDEDEATERGYIELRQGHLGEVDDREVHCAEEIPE